ncbi:MAG: hypothetical protein AB7G93_10795 [Bdellovibrionales bacterium]
MKHVIYAVMAWLFFIAAALESHASTVEYFDCKPVQVTPDSSYELTAYVAENGAQTLVTVTKKEDPGFYMVVGTVVANSGHVITYSGVRFLLTIYNNPMLPTLTFTGHLSGVLAGSQIDTPMVCQLLSYEKPEGSGPGGVSVHN